MASNATLQKYPPLDPEVPYPIALSGYYSELAVGIAKGGYCLVLTMCPGSDEMYETITHYHTFPTMERAEAFRTRVLAARSIDLRWWRWSPSVCSPYDFMHRSPCLLPPIGA